MQILIPCENEILRCKATQQDPYRVGPDEALSLSLERELTSIIYEGEITGFRRCEEARKDLVKRHDFSTYACFRAVDILNEGEINLDNLRAFMKRAGHYPNEEEIVAAVRRLDLDADSSVSYAEFSEALKPQEFSLTNHYLLPD
jgi:hypothetical protein